MLCRKFELILIDIFQVIAKLIIIIIIIIIYLWICLNLKIIITEMTFHPKLEYRSTVVLANLRLLRIISYTHTNMGATPIAPDIER